MIAFEDIPMFLQQLAPVLQQALPQQQVPQQQVQQQQVQQQQVPKQVPPHKLERVTGGMKKRLAAMKEEMESDFKKQLDEALKKQSEEFAEKIAKLIKPNQ
jgi:L-lactate utilization protein LutC